MTLPCLTAAADRGQVVFLGLAMCALCMSVCAQEIPINEYSVSESGRIQIPIQASADSYYVLTAKHNADDVVDYPVSLTLGVDGELSITEPLFALPVNQYKLWSHPTIRLKRF